MGKENEPRVLDTYQNEQGQTVRVLAPAKSRELRVGKVPLPRTPSGSGSGHVFQYNHFNDEFARKKTSETEASEDEVGTEQIDIPREL